MCRKSKRGKKVSKIILFDDIFDMKNKRNRPKKARERGPPTAEAASPPSPDTPPISLFHIDPGIELPDPGELLKHYKVGPPNIGSPPKTVGFGFDPGPPINPFGIGYNTDNPIEPVGNVFISNPNENINVNFNENEPPDKNDSGSDASLVNPMNENSYFDSDLPNSPTIDGFDPESPDSFSFIDENDFLLNSQIDFFDQDQFYLMQLTLDDLIGSKFASDG